ncbi:glycosyltransferase family 2 protein [Faecalibacter macacae]|uniref:Glycosyltransferase family 2 protein n=1 Tax=Faecalibacter macacae TaxID=1859289 RepID=A0A3L9MI04_9FLAO|nr:glycosyltransferase family A protein [Faecalibacter macacae]RLZ12710.1 glycosyltransferase family 2 protein [Faecalibacter macacae]
MKFSILIAHYNNDLFFKDCYNSIINQSYQDFEVIIVDDYSEVTSIKEVKNLIKNDIRFKFFQNSSNKGVGYTKNKCIEFASGDICGFVDPDDALRNDAVEKMVEFFKKKDCVAAYSKMMLCDNQLQPINPFNRTKQIINRDKYFVNINNNITHFFSFKKHIYDLTEKIDPNLRRAEDQDLYLKLYEKGRILFIDDCLYNYRLHKNGLTQGEDKGKSDFLNVIKKTFKRRKINKFQKFEDEDLYNKLIKKEQSINKRIIRYYLNHFII